MSRHHKGIDSKRWAKVRRQALERAGFKSEKTGLRGQLEADHICPIDKGGAIFDLDNIQILTRAEHIAKTADENRREPSPEEEAWRKLLTEMSESAK